MKLIQYFCLLLLLVIGVGCEENMPLTYEGKDAVYIYSTNHTRTTEQTFFLIPESQERDTIWIQVQLMGKVASKKRPFVLKQINVAEDNAAISGIHYVSFDDSEMSSHLFIEKDCAEVQVPIILLRTPDMELNKYKLVLAIEENEYFAAIDLPYYADYTIMTTAIAVKPSRWDTTWHSLFGEWGSEKMKFIIEATGYTSWDESINDSQYKAYLQTKCKTALYEYNQSHPDEPLTEADGTLVEFP